MAKKLKDLNIVNMEATVKPLFPSLRKKSERIPHRRALLLLKEKVAEVDSANAACVQLIALAESLIKQVRAFRYTSADQAAREGEQTLRAIRQGRKLPRNDRGEV